MFSSEGPKDSFLNPSNAFQRQTTLTESVYEEFDAKDGTVDFSAKAGFMLYSAMLGLTAFLCIMSLVFTIGLSLRKKGENSPLLLLLLNGAFLLLGYFIFQMWKAMSSSDLSRALHGKDGFVFSMMASTVYFYIIFLCTENDIMIVVFGLNLVLHLVFIFGATKVVKALEEAKCQRDDQSFEGVIF